MNMAGILMQKRNLRHGWLNHYENVTNGLNTLRIGESV
jgi:hypothetical protein